MHKAKKLNCKGMTSPQLFLLKKMQFFLAEILFWDSGKIIANFDFKIKIKRYDALYTPTHVFKIRYKKSFFSSGQLHTPLNIQPCSCVFILVQKAIQKKNWTKYGKNEPKKNNKTKQTTTTASIILRIISYHCVFVQFPRLLGVLLSNFFKKNKILICQLEFKIKKNKRYTGIDGQLSSITLRWICQGVPCTRSMIAAIFRLH